MEKQRIIISKKEEIAEVVEKIIDAEAKEIIISVPRFALMSESEANFRLMKREAETLQKRLVIESVDEAVLAHAKKADLEFINPFFSETKERVSDIRNESRHQGSNRESPPEAPRDVAPLRHANHIQKENFQSHEAPHHETKEYASHAAPKENHDPKMVGTVSRRRRSIFRPSFIVVLMLIIAGIVAGFIFLPKADIKIVAAKTDWDYAASITVDKDITEINAETASIPGEIFAHTKNLQLQFPASGRKSQAVKARGTITIYNAYNESPQILIATTRFEAPDGKIFRILEDVEVPGAKSVDGKLEPASIEASVIADEAGETYNIDPVEKFTIPGFSGSSKFTGFYGTSKAQMSGGFIGEAPFPSETDMREAKITTAQKLEESMRLLMLAQLPHEFTLVEGATQFSLTKEEVNTYPNTDGTFSTFAEGTMSAIAFRKNDLLNLVHQKLKEETDNSFVIDTDTLAFGEPEFKDENTMVLSLDYQASLMKNIDENALKDRIIGKSENDLKAMLFSVAGLESAEVSLWPFWVRKTPSKSSRIFITVD